MADTLVLLKELLSNPKSWTQGVVARDAEGKPTDVFSDEATCWCLFGGLMKVEDTYRVSNLPSANRIRKALKGYGTKQTFIGFNDMRTHQEVMALIDEAIQCCL